MGQTFVAYSLGNLLFDALPSPRRGRQGAILLVRLQRGAVIEVDIRPTLTDNGRVVFATGEDAAAIRARLALPSE